MSRLTSLLILVLGIGLFACEEETFLEIDKPQAMMEISTQSSTNDWYFGKRISNGEGSAWSLGHTNGSTNWHALGAQVKMQWNFLNGWPSFMVPLPSKDGVSASFEAIGVSHQSVKLTNGRIRDGLAFEFFMPGESAYLWRDTLVYFTSSEQASFPQDTLIDFTSSEQATSYRDSLIWWKMPIPSQPGETVANPIVYTSYTQSGTPRSIVVHVDLSLGNFEIQMLQEVYDLIPPKDVQNLFDPTAQLRIRKNSDTGIYTVLLNGLSLDVVSK